jgi:hypothetical protein
MSALLAMVNKKNRRTRAEMDAIRDALYRGAEAEHPVGDRRLFYRLVNEKVIPKLEKEYKGTVVRLLGEMRENGTIPWEWITDGSRLCRRPRTHESLEEAVEETVSRYRQRLWTSQDVHVEIWCEKVGMMGVLYPITSRWDVPLYLCGGSPSKAFLRNAAKEMEAGGKPAHLYYLGDFDPSGVAIRHRVERDLRRYAPTAQIEFTHLAVTEEQIKQYSLPLRPTKTRDPNAKKFGDRESVELDAMPVDVVRDMVEACIEQHVDQWTLHHTRLVEAAERDTGEMFLRNWNAAVAGAKGAA